MALPRLLARGLEELAADGFRPRPGEAHDRHPTLSRGDGGGDGGDGVGGGGQGEAPGGPGRAGFSVGGRG